MVRLSKLQKLFGLISGDIIYFVSSNRSRLETRNFEVIVIFIHIATKKKATMKGKSVDTFEQNKRFLSASLRKLKKHLFCR